MFSISGFGQTAIQIENLKTFGKVYGYVKYFHPSDEAANLDWDNFAIYGAAQVEKCQTQEELMQTLNLLFLPIAPSIQFYPSNTDVKFNINSIIPPKPKKFKPVYWQHEGLGYGMEYGNIGAYQSIRVNRKTLVDRTPNSFGNLMTHLYASDYRGKTLKFTGQVKLADGSQGSGHLWLRVDKPGDQVGFFDNMDDRPITSHTWKEYEIIGDVDLLAKGIAFGCFLSGSGTLLVDDMHLYYLENKQWIEIFIGNKGFEMAKIGKDKTWIGRSDGDYKIKTTHQDCFKGKKCVMITKTKELEVISGEKIFESSPAIGEYIQKSIGSGISCNIPLSLYGNNKFTFPIADKIALDNLKKNISIEDTGLALRLGDIIITWNIFQHFYPYFDVVKVDWENEMEKALRKCYKDKNKKDFLLTLQQFTATLQDGHINVIGLPYSASFQPRMGWEFIDNKLVITEVCQWGSKLKVGDIVTQINGMTPEHYFDSIKTTISAATPGFMAYRANQEALTGQKQSELNLVVNNETIPLNRSMEIKDYKGCNPKKTTYKLMDSGIVYLNLDLIEMKTIDSLLPELEKAKAIICDLRGYPNSNHDFIAYLLNKDDHDQWMFIPQFIYPDREKLVGYMEIGWEMRPKKPHLKAKIIFIIDGSAISYAESFMGFIEGYQLATIVGQPTAGTNGNVNAFMLPGAYFITWTGMKVLKHNGKQQHGVGITPDVLVTKTIQGVLEGRDEFLEKAIEIAKER